MALLPRQEITFVDPGLGTVGLTDRGTLVMGTSSIGTVDVLTSFSVKQDVVDALGQGPLPEGICRVLDIAGGPVFGMRLNGSVAGVAGSVTKTGTASGTGTITVAGAPFDSYRVKIDITKAGVLGGGEFKYSLDFTSNADAGSSSQNEGRTFSPTIVIPAGGSFVIPNTNLTLTFVPGSGTPTTFDLGDINRFDCTAPLYSTSDLATAFTALLLTSQALRTIQLEGEHATASASATMFAALNTHLTSMETAFRFVGGIMDGGSLEDDRAAAITAHASSQSSRISLPYGYADITSSKPFTGWGTIQRTYVGLVGSRVASDLVSTDSARFDSGAVVGVVAIRTDEERSPLLNADNFTTMRTWQGQAGFYITNNNLRSSTGSDFKFWQHRALMDLGSDIVIKAQQSFIKRAIPVNEDGTIKNTAALKMEADVQNQLQAGLMSPKDAEGNKGHISDFGYSIDRTTNLLTSETLNTTTKIRPKGYASVISSTIGFSNAVG